MWTSKEIEQALNISGISLSQPCTGISIDSRTVKKGDLFFALRGENSDGHFYVSEALHKGAIAVFVEKIQDHIPAAKQILVPSARKAMEQLAAFARQKTEAKVAAITGSAGKTTTKEMLAFILGKVGKVIYSRESYNNDIGVPFSLAHIEKDTDFGVFEVGMNNPGEIAPLTMMVRPHVAIITSLGESHIGLMGSEEAIAEEKSEVMRGLDSNGTAIFPHDTKHTSTLLKKARSFSIEHIKTFGKQEGAYAQLLTFKPNNQGTGGEVTVKIGEKTYVYILGIPGEHSALNSLAVLLAVESFGLSIEDALPFFKDFSPVRGRGLRHVLPFKNGYLTLIDDAYNANPSSMRAGLSVLGAIDSIDKKGRKIAVLGDMKELGQGSPEYHKALSLVIDSVGVDLVFASGTDMKYLYDVLPLAKKGGYSETPEGLIPIVMHAVHENDLVFVKGSKGSYVSKVVDAFLHKKVG